MEKDIKTRLSEEEERKLGEQIQQGNTKAVDSLVTANLGFVVSIARQYANKGLDLDDLVSEGNIALMLAAYKWNPEKGIRFVQYAVWDIRKAMEQALGQQVNVVRKPQSDTLRMSQVSMDAPLRQGYTRTLGESMPARNNRSQQEEVDNNSMGYGLSQCLNVLSDRELKIITLFYGLDGDQMNMTEIGEHMQLKRERVRQIRKKAERKLRPYLREIMK